MRDEAHVTPHQRRGLRRPLCREVPGEVEQPKGGGISRHRWIAREWSECDSCLRINEVVRDVDMATMLNLKMKWLQRTGAAAPAGIQVCVVLRSVSVRSIRDAMRGPRCLLGVGSSFYIYTSPITPKGSSSGPPSSIPSSRRCATHRLSGPHRVSGLCCSLAWSLGSL